MLVHVGGGVMVGPSLCLASDRIGTGTRTHSNPSGARRFPFFYSRYPLCSKAGHRWVIHNWRVTSLRPKSSNLRDGPHRPLHRHSFHGFTNDITTLRSSLLCTRNGVGVGSRLEHTSYVQVSAVSTRSPSNSRGGALWPQLVADPQSGARNPGE